MFFPGKVCGSLGQCVDPGPRISTTNKIATDPAECGTDAAKLVTTAAANQELTGCHIICNDTGAPLTHFTLIVNGVPEFEDRTGELSPGACALARRSFRANGSATLEEILAEIRATWVAGTSALPPDGSDAEAGSTAGVTQVFTDTQLAFVIVSRFFGAPAVSGWIAGLLGAGLLGLGIRRLRR